jgi:hypothetical protein
MRFTGLGSNERKIVGYSQILSPESINLFSGLDPAILDDPKRDEIIRVLLATRMIFLSNITSTERQYIIRELSPYLDFVDHKFEPFKTSEWIQQANIDSSMADNGTHDNYQLVYVMNRYSKLDLKTICIYAIRIPSSEGINVEEIEFWRAGVKLIDRLFLSGHDKERIVFLNSPIIFCGRPFEDHYNSQGYEIRFKYTDKKKEENHIKFCGYVCESVGLNVLG